MDELLADFLTEAIESLAAADRALLALEHEPQDQAAFAALFRTVHTLKGSSSFLPLPRLAGIASTMEHLLAELRSGQVAPHAMVTLGLLAGLQRIKFIIDRIVSTGQEPRGDDSELVAVFAELDQGATSTAEPSLNSPALNLDLTAPGAGSVTQAEFGTIDEPAEPGVARTIRVGTAQLDRLTQTANALLAHSTQLLRLAPADAGAAFHLALQQLLNLTADLQKGLRHTRMQPIGALRGLLTRLVQSLGQQLGKQIQFIMIGADTKVDRHVLDLMRDCMIHMLRNSADHGLESPAERQHARKPVMGRITVAAYEERGHVFIEIGDDGRGLQTSAIKHHILAQELATEAEIAAMDTARIQNFVFLPGFTTAREVTAISGHGVGLDVVKANISQAGGTIWIDSTFGEGVNITIRIPLTLAAIPPTTVNARKRGFAVQQPAMKKPKRGLSPGTLPGHSTDWFAPADGSCSTAMPVCHANSNSGFQAVPYTVAAMRQPQMATSAYRR